jgi:WD40 repeat protein
MLLLLASLTIAGVLLYKVWRGPSQDTRSATATPEAPQPNGTSPGNSGVPASTSPTSNSNPSARPSVTTPTLVRTFPGNKMGGGAIAFSIDGRWLAAGGADKTIKVWDVDSGQLVNTLYDENAIRSVEFNPDGPSLASVDIHGNVSIWSFAPWAKVRSLSMPYPGLDVRAIAFSGDVQSLATGGQTTANPGSIKMWNVNTWGETRSPAAYGRVISLAFSRDGRWLASGNDPDPFVQLWNVNTWQGERLQPLQTKGIPSLAFSWDGRFLAAGSYDSTIRIWDVATRKEVHTIHTGVTSVLSVAFSPDNQWIAAAVGDNTVRIWTVATWQNIYTLPGHGVRIDKVAFSPDGRYLAAVRYDATVELWSLPAGH